MLLRLLAKPCSLFFSHCWICVPGWPATQFTAREGPHCHPCPPSPARLLRCCTHFTTPVFCALVAQEYREQLAQRIPRNRGKNI